MATSAGIIINHLCVSSSISSGKLTKHYQMKTTLMAAARSNYRCRVNCVNNNNNYMARNVALDPYEILRIHSGASEAQVKKTFRELALKYHPDVCKGSDCGVQFQQINEAYDKVMDDLRDERRVAEMRDEPLDDMMRGTDDPDSDMWEEWMGWEGAGIRDYSSHINPYI